MYFVGIYPVRSINDLAKPQEGLECEIQLTYEATKIITHFSWPVNDTQKEFLENVFAKVAKINAQRDQLVDLIDRRIGDTPDLDSKWRLLSKYVKDDDDAYQLTIINMQTYAFSLTLEIDL